MEVLNMEIRIPKYEFETNFTEVYKEESKKEED